MVLSSPGLAILILCVSIMSWTASRSSAQRVKADDLPQDVCANQLLEDPIRCGCYGYRRALKDPEWSSLREECNRVLNGNIDDGRRFCSNDFISNGGSLERSELRSFFNNTFVTCAVPFFDLDYPPPSPGPSARFVYVSRARTETKFEHYFSGHPEVPFHPAVRMLGPYAGRHLKELCYTIVFFTRRELQKAKQICG